MKSSISPALRRILEDTRREIDQDKSRTSTKRLKQMIRDAVPLASFAGALSGGKAVIAEIKEKSPSQGKMRRQNVAEAAREYKQSRIVKAISVLTSWNNFGANMRVEMMKAIKQQTAKPVLRKDFIIEEYQVYQARAFGADAILLMANILEAEQMRRLSELASELGLDVLFETHSPDELADLPESAKIIGINSRSFEGGLRASNFVISRFMKQWLKVGRDHSVNLQRFAYASRLPGHVLKVAESGISPGNCAQVFSLGFQAILVGTSLLVDPRGVRPGLEEFEAAIRGLAAPRTTRALQGASEGLT